MSLRKGLHFFPKNFGHVIYIIDLDIHGRRKACWVMKIIKLVGWIGLGICIKSKILESGYKFHYENLGHGSYMISSNGYSWSSSVKTHNSAYFSGFSFGAGDFVIV